MTKKMPRAFKHPLYVTRPMLPPLEDYMRQLSDVWDSQWLTNGGKKHIALEKSLGAFFENQNISLFNNGTIAMVTACQALRLSGEVITTPFTFPATPHVLSWNNITPVFADIDATTMTLDPRNIEPLITGRTSAILGVHVYGLPCDVEGIQSLADRHGLRVIYDAAHAFGTRIFGKPVTAFGDASMLSFHATKLFHTAEGGALLVRASDIKKRVDFLKNFGIADESTVLMPGINGKMSELQAALGLLTLNMVSTEKIRRQNIAALYCEYLSELPGIILPESPDGVEVSHQYFPIRINHEHAHVTRDAVYEGLRRCNVYARKYFYPLCSEYSCYRMLPSANPAYLPIAHKAASQVLCLPFYGALSDNEVLGVCEIIRNLMRC